MNSKAEAALRDDVEPEGAPGLEQALFEDAEPPELAVAPAHATPAPAGGPWPATVPGAEDARAFLLGRLAPMSWEKVTSAVLGELSAFERDILAEETLPEDFERLRSAILFGWRVAAALATAPSPDAAVHRQKLDELLAAGDAILDGIRTPDGLEGLPAQGFESAKNRLSRDLVALSGLSHRYTKAAVVGPTAEELDQQRARAAVLARTASSAKLVSIDAADAQPEPDRTRRLVVMLAVLMVISAGYNGYRLLQRPPPPRAPTKDMVGIPAGAQGLRAPDGSGNLSFATQTPLAPEERARLEAQAARDGKVLKQLSPNVYVVESPESETSHPKP